MTHDSRKRLARLVTLQERLKELHEARRAGHLREAAAAEEEMRELARRFDEPESLSSLFPELYHARIARASARVDANRLEAEAEARNVAASDARATVASRAHGEAARKDERETEEKGMLEMLQHRIKP
ncbi:hypothetical protein [Nitratireductor luteus]|uniref:hypothetical protein n=1 Tax=Nitratireductor luteus TaxID=2976980 RepID=UPI00223F2D82|nr:hypothetical protein [Nitratireductor luteus]